MKVFNLMGEEKVLLENEKEMKLKYYLIESSTGTNGVTLYGIKVEKIVDEEKETEEINGVSYSKEFVTQIISTLIQYTVTPISLIEIVDEYVTLQQCC